MVNHEGEPHQQVDILIVGGGVNGAGIARDASGRGLKVMLVEKDDLASHTSSASSKLIHGGLRYLEYYEFRLVREALTERENLLKIAPHIIWPMRFVLPHENNVRPAWLVRLGLFLYDHLGKKQTLPRCQGVSFKNTVYGAPIKSSIERGFIYSDCAVMDSRLVVLNAIDAVRHGADVRVHTRLVSAKRDQDQWVAEIENTTTGKQTTVRCKVLVNAAGPWVSSILSDTLSLGHEKNLRLVKGSHIIVPKLYEGTFAYILQNPDKRIVFAIPYEEQFTLIGTTDIPWKKDPQVVEISEEEVSYLCETINRHFRKKISAKDVVWSYAGVRPLYDNSAQNASAVTRDYVFDINAPEGGAPILSIFGGKITTYRKLAEHAMEKLLPYFPELSSRSAWTATKALPGGNLGKSGFGGLLDILHEKAGFLDERMLYRLARTYGSAAFNIIGNSKKPEDLGKDFGGGLTESEILYLIKHEWARKGEDILWRRTRMGLHLTAEQSREVDSFVEETVAKHRDNLF
ncbi:glycerol-3-phosphate dehydrogenase [Entomobacter blattae]|uniref:Glycerol-3-phosphate dehydrogenase n=1 Tax=Entomobacter blattae TaxID=2762277 RepID=A0A7H1NUY8_9PROT|nr:glycerol-3-phosphate dehydrogenase [Entomobacter blattae]QNT79598.1 Aerobic glycerol-3-phosphate dehydrogenase [Entomobacter blattae]